MNIVVIGLGSMGKRRIRLIQQIDPAVYMVGVDSREDRRAEASGRFGIPSVARLTEIELPIDCAFICTAPLTHASIITECLHRGWHVFTELNLVADAYSENTALAKKRKVVLFLSSTFLYRDEVRYIREQVADCGCTVNYSYHVGQYLPDWHPWESYKSFFVNDKRTNGCRELMAIELPWLIKTFGDVIGVTVRSGKMTELDIDHDDNYVMLLEHASGAKGTFLVDVVSRKPVRNLEIFGELIFLSWDGSPSGLFHFDIIEKVHRNVNLYTSVDQQEGYSTQIVENAYKNEILAFFAQIQGGKPAEYSFEDDERTLALIDTIESKGTQPL